MARVNLVEDFVQVAFDARLVFEVRVEKPAMGDVLHERVGRHPDREENHADDRMPGPACKRENDNGVARVESRGFIEALPGNPGLLSFINI